MSKFFLTLLVTLFQLFELLGFGQFEFIQELLTRRREVVTSMLEAPTSAPTGAASLRLRETLESRPNYGAQVTIQVSVC